MHSISLPYLDIQTSDNKLKWDFVQCKDCYALGFLNKQDIDFAFLKEVTHVGFSAIRSYTGHVKEGTERRRTALIVNEGIALTNIKV
jgi:hypothetical protein